MLNKKRKEKKNKKFSFHLYYKIIFDKKLISVSIEFSFPFVRSMDTRKSGKVEC